MNDDFDLNKINFDVEINELALRYSALKRAVKDITDDDTFIPNMRLDILVNLQAEISHIKKIYNILSFNKPN